MILQVMPLIIPQSTAWHHLQTALLFALTQFAISSFSASELLFTVGVFYAISTLLNQIVLFHYPGAEEDAGRIGLCIVVAGMMGSVCCGVILDKTHRFKCVWWNEVNESSTRITVVPYFPQGDDTRSLCVNNDRDVHLHVHNEHGLHRRRVHDILAPWLLYDGIFASWIRVRSGTHLSWARRNFIWLAECWRASLRNSLHNALFLHSRLVWWYRS